MTADGTSEPIDYVARWRQWLAFPDEHESGPIGREVARLWHRRKIYRIFMEIGDQAPQAVSETGAEFQRWVMSIYGDAQLMAIRRQAERGRGNEISLRRMLEEMRDNSDDPRLQQRASEDLLRLTTRTEGAIRQTTLRIAHLLDPDHPTYDHAGAERAGRITFAEVHGCVDVIADIYTSYVSTFFDTTIALDYWVMSHWDRAFRTAWIVDDDWYPTDWQ